jgi:DnaJ-class molecular chaperone
MAKVKTNSLKKKICDNCHGNGFVKIKPSNYMLKLLIRIALDDSQVHQCWVCDSEGEVYEERTDLIDDNPFSNKLH